jgi:23S rRNA G2069 N7-methylase RlmK/C1962 C5-methylase RlmI
MFYFDKTDPRVLFLDNREIKTTLCDGREFEVSPDIIADFTKIPFENNSFSLVIFDPPHLLKIGDKSWLAQKYGKLNENWQDEISKGFAECFRVLSPLGVLVFKWNETDIKVSEILKLTTEKAVIGHRSGKKSNTHWICFIKGKKV